jgi:predicted nuclease with TOPRIM domain
MNNETQHTAEKWTIVGVTEVTIVDADGRTIYEASDYIEDYHEAKRITSLIASAPSLLKENQELKAELNTLQQNHISLLDRASVLAAERDELKSINEELIKALEGLAAYFKYMVKDPQFKEYRDAMEILSKSKTEKP